MCLKSKPRKPLIGYARVSTQQQDLARQIKALKRLGCSAIYSDTASGKSMAGRPELARALDDLDTGDELVIAEWDRATRSMWDDLDNPRPPMRARAVWFELRANVAQCVRDTSAGREHLLFRKQKYTDSQE